MQKSIRGMLTVFAALCTGCASHQLQDSGSVPGVRNGHSMVYHEALRSLLMFGGADERQVTGETWKWKNGQWEKVPGHGPVPRTFGAMVYNSEKAQVVLFGGNRVLFGPDEKEGLLLNDTWIWEDGRWTEVAAPTRPPARSECAITYDENRNVVIIFGGFRFSDDGKSLVRFGDTWEFDGLTWKNVSARGPSPRSGSVMAFDPESRHALLFGGNFPRQEPDRKSYNGTTWKYHQGNWEAVSSTVLNLYNSSMTYHRGRGSFFRFGGWNGSARIADTWEFREGSWIPVITGGHAPQSRNHTVLVYDSHDESIFLYGGHDGEKVFGDLWTFRDNKWMRIFDQPALQRIDNGH